MPNNKIKILVTGVGGPAGVNAVRLFERFKDRAEIFGVDSDPLSAGRFFVEDFAVIPLASDTEKYASEFSKKINEWQIDYILPTVAEELVIIGEALGGYKNKLIISDLIALEICHDKRKLYAWVQAHMPEMMPQWQTLDQPINFKAEQYFIKPAFGRGARGCRVINADELGYLTGRQDAGQSETIMMEILPGKEWTVDAYINKDGSYAFIAPRSRLSLSGGISAKGRTEKNEKLIALTKKLLDGLSCRGPICVQWKNDKNGEPKLVEINPRLSGGIMITALAGADPIECLLAEIENRAIVNQDWKEITVVRYLTEKIIND